MAWVRVKARCAIGTDQNHPPRENEVICRHMNEPEVMIGGAQSKVSEDLILTDQQTRDFPLRHN